VGPNESVEAKPRINVAVKIAHGKTGGKPSLIETPYDPYF